MLLVASLELAAPVPGALILLVFGLSPLAWAFFELPMGALAHGIYRVVYTIRSALDFIIHRFWAVNYLTHSVIKAVCLFPYFLLKLAHSRAGTR